MAKAVFHKNQRVYVKPVGTWALIERVNPQWASNVEEPLRIFYDVGLGRDFSAQELSADVRNSSTDRADRDNWRLMRAPNKWRSEEDCGHHPFPGTFPVIVTDTQDWGGWRVPGAEYDRDPLRVEFQARVIANALPLLQIANALSEHADENPDDIPSALAEITREAFRVRRRIYDEPYEGERHEAAE